jgi:mannose-6-phosphate isomerase
MEQRDYIPAGESGKTEAWVVLEAGPASRIYAGLKPGTTRDDLEAGPRELGRWRTFWQASRRGSATPFSSEPGPFTLSAVLWCSKCRKTATSRFACMTGIASTPRQASLDRLQVEQAIACIDFEQVAIGPVAPVVEEAAPVRRERLFHCEHFSVWRHSGTIAVHVGAADTPRVLVCIAGEGRAGAQRHQLSRRPRRRRALAGGGRRDVPTGRAMQSACWKSHCRNSSVSGGHKE